MNINLTLPEKAFDDVDTSASFSGASIHEEYPSTAVNATARLQFHEGFTFAHATELVDYYAALGISHLYASPILTARMGSTHGYDTVDPTQINPELGGETAFRALVAKLRSVDMGLIVDIVPNHMGVGGSENAWWQHVLEWGANSPYARWFDINWHSADPALHNKLLAPFLGAAYGETLKSGDLKLKFDAGSGRIQLCYHAHHFPIAVNDYAYILNMADSTSGSELLRPMLLRMIEIDWSRPYVEIEDNAALLQDHLRMIAQSEEGALAIATALEHFNAAHEQGWRALHALLERQHYRLTWWRNGADEINWRRFFEVSELAGMRMEEDEVFEATHALIFRLYEEGLIDGLRIDHVDGLADPRAYCRKLRQRLLALTAKRPEPYRIQPYIIVEKILAEHETLRDDWQLDGTTGYDFMDQVAAVLHDPAGEVPLAYLWRKLTGDKLHFSQHVQNARRQLLAENLISEFEGCALALHAIARADIDTRDYSLATIRRVLREILINFPVYRTYASCAGRDAIDQEVFDVAAQKAQKALNNIDRPVVDILSRWLSGELATDASANSELTTHELISEQGLPLPMDQKLKRLCQQAITRFQQLTPPLAAKSVEDTAFYRYGRLLSRNEVGSDPGSFSIAPMDFHALCLQRQEQYPLSMLATATHDHKRGEDVRSRIAVLSEMPVAWEHTLSDWMQRNVRFRTRVEEEDGLTPAYKGPRPWHEIMLYEMIVGAWPLDLQVDDHDGLHAFAERLAEWQTKAIREAKRLSNWVQNNEVYEAACRDFLFNILNPQLNAECLLSMYRFVELIAPAGVINSLTQMTLRLTVPGVPDLYQGTELWDWSLVDPDNRRPVDFALRKTAMASNTQKISPSQSIRQDKQASALADNWQGKAIDWKSGFIKQHMLQQALLLRQQQTRLFKQGTYLPLEVTGALASHVMAFMRSEGDAAIIVVVSRLPQALERMPESPMLVPQQWQGTSITLPSNHDTPWASGMWLDIYTQSMHTFGDTALPVSAILANLPQAVLSYRPPL